MNILHLLASRSVIILSCVALHIALYYALSAQTLLQTGRANTDIHAEIRIITDSAYSPVLQRMKRFVVLLPATVSAPRPNSIRRMPVLYLLHGWGGSSSDWSQRTRLAEYVQKFSITDPILIVMPDAENSWYVNSATLNENRYEDYITRELPTTIAARYAADTNRQAIAGLSMGGYGAVMLSMKYPHKYIVAGSFSGAVTMPRDLSPEIHQRGSTGNNVGAASGNFALPSLYAAFSDNPQHPVRTANDIFHRMQTVTSSIRVADSTTPTKQPYFYVATGIQDPLRSILTGNRELRDSLYATGLRYEYHETPGKHNWQYWDEALCSFLPRLVELFNASALSNSLSK
jgi:putative tributyrin esterase